MKGKLWEKFKSQMIDRKDNGRSGPIIQSDNFHEQEVLNWEPYRPTFEEEAFMSSFLDYFLKSEAWYEMQQTLIKWVEENNFGELSEYHSYGGLDKWELAYTMDIFVFNEIFNLVDVVGVTDLDFELGQPAAKFLAKYFFLKILECNPDDRQLYVDKMRTLVSEYGRTELSAEGSLFRWVSEIS